MHLGDQTHVQLPSCRARYPYRTWTPSYAKHSCDLLYYHYSLSLTTSLTFTLQWRSFTRYFTISPLPPHAAAITGVHPYFSIQKRRGNSRVLALVEVCFVVQQQLVLSFKLVSCIFAAKTILDHSLTSTVHCIQSLYNVWLLRKVATLRSLWLLHNVHPCSQFHILYNPWKSKLLPSYPNLVWLVWG